MALKPTYNNPMTKTPAKPYYGIDGWLRVIQLHMAYYAVVLIYNLIQILRLAGNGIDNYLVIVNSLILAFQITLIIVSFILMVNKLMLFRVFYTILLAIFLLNSLTQLASGNAIMGIYNTVICIGWIAYLYKSERVKNTFRKIGQTKTEYEASLERKINEADDSKEVEPEEV